MNKGFYKDLDTNFEQAYMLCISKFTHAELINMLTDGNIPQRQIAALNLDGVFSEEDAKVLISNLTGCDGKIREAVALKFYQIVSTNNDALSFFSKIDPSIYADATIDINANICRLVVDAMNCFDKQSEFIKMYVENLIELTKKSLCELDKFIFRDKKYVINKQIFKLYWCLEALRNYYNIIDKEILLEILKRSMLQNEYTIREKVAQISVLSDDLSDIKNKLATDENYYVRMVILNH